MLRLEIITKRTNRRSEQFTFNDASVFYLKKLVKLHKTLDALSDRRVPSWFFKEIEPGDELIVNRRLIVETMQKLGGKRKLKRLPSRFLRWNFVESNDQAGKIRGDALAFVKLLKIGSIKS